MSKSTTTGITMTQALNATEFHAGECSCHTGPRGGRTVHCETWRRSGATKTWKTRPGEFRIPVKYGLRESSYITHRDTYFHAAEDCPLNGR